MGAFHDVFHLSAADGYPRGRRRSLFVPPPQRFNRIRNQRRKAIKAAGGIRQYKRINHG